MTRDEIIEDLEQVQDLIENSYSAYDDGEKRRKGQRILAQLIRELKREKYLNA